MATQLVWFKRDLRVSDHAPLAEASRRGPCLCLYVYEPEVLHAAEHDASHLGFVNESLAELRDNLRRRGGELLVRAGRMPDVLAELHHEHPFEAIWAHEETGSLATYARDRRVARWARERGVAFHEAPSEGVVRRLASRDGWAERWRKRMSAPPLPAPERVPTHDGLAPGGLLDAAQLGLAPSTITERQRGGESLGRRTLESFLRVRGAGYRSAMSSPNEGWDACSRVSPYLAYGCLSTRQAHHAAARRAAEVRGLVASGAGIDPRWPDAIRSFESRLCWRSHFMQKLEDQPDLEERGMNDALDGLRPKPEEPASDGIAWDALRYAAWREGRTGYPMVDAVMRCLASTGWINFRMRAMAASFVSYHLWLDWREPARFLATRFVDYEPGIHYSQFQMQAGATGISTVRIYSPKKQLLDQDPRGVFVRRWVPELEGVPDEHLAEPHRMSIAQQSAAGCRVGVDYPAPIVDHAAAYGEARRRMFAAKRRADVRAASARVYQKHGSRRRPRRR